MTTPQLSEVIEAAILEAQSQLFTISFLVELGRFADARSAWRQALAKLDLDDERVTENEIHAWHFLYWVALAWFEAGETREAKRILDRVSSRIVMDEERLERLRRLRNQIEDALESGELGESVYPTEFPMSERWKPPSALPLRNASKQELARWYPGRVLRADAQGVELVFATTEENPPERHVLRQQLDADEWTLAAQYPPEDAKGYIFIAVYADDTIRIVKNESVAPVLSSERDAADPLRYLREQWS
jgi:hypothetical protein